MGLCFSLGDNLGLFLWRLEEAERWTVDGDEQLVVGIGTGGASSGRSSSDPAISAEESLNPNGHFPLDDGAGAGRAAAARGGGSKSGQSSPDAAVVALSLLTIF